MEAKYKGTEAHNICRFYRHSPDAWRRELISGLRFQISSQILSYSRKALATRQGDIKMSFATGLVNRLSQGLEQRLNDKRQQRTQQEQQAQQLQQQQALFEQGQQQQLQAQPQQLQMQEAQIRNTARIQQELIKEAQKIQIETTPGLRELLASGDMQKIQAELPNLIQTQGDVDFFNTYKKIASNLATPEDQAYQRESGRQRGLLEGKLAMQKEGLLGRLSSGKSSGGSGKAKKTPLSEVDKVRLESIKREIFSIQKTLRDSELTPNETDQLNAQLRDAMERLRAMSAPAGSDSFNVPTPAKPIAAAQTTNAPAAEDKNFNALMSDLSKFKEAFSEKFAAPKRNAVNRTEAQSSSPSTTTAALNTPSLVNALAGISPQNKQKRQATTMKRQPPAQEMAKQQTFSNLATVIAKQLNRQLSDDELGFIASGVFDGGFDKFVFDLDGGTYTMPNAASKEPLSGLVTSKIGDFAAQNVFQAIPNARSSLAKLLRGSVLTDKGAEAFSR
ncbi:MAG: hypothetical protein CVV42_10685 [Candidatus Riflebacteria bacterium HGW-Riflebacteria-2]|jgi:hypothetical protein|nr:MAG: hypothetical protein CVV42_10685 [Candidatus Riflebacteria bacterium HGW-Riflebacteria-2]